MQIAKNMCARLNSRAHVREGEKGEACLLTLRLLELNIRTPGCGFTQSRGGLRSATGKNGWLLFTHLKLRAEGYETEILTKLHFKSHKPHRVHAKTPNIYCEGDRGRWIARTAVGNGDSPWHFTARRTKFHCRQSPKCKWMNRVRNTIFLGQKIATKGNVTASWRQRNRRSGWRVRQYKLTTWLRQRRRRAISQWIGVIL